VLWSLTKEARALPGHYPAEPLLKEPRRSETLGVGRDQNRVGAIEHRAVVPVDAARR